MMIERTQLLRRPVRRVARLVARRLAPERVRFTLARVPFSRYHSVASWLLRGPEVIAWRGVRVAAELVGLLRDAGWSLSLLEGSAWLPLAGGLGAAPRAHILATRLAGRAR